MIIDALQSLEKESRKRGIPILGSEKGTWLLKKVEELEPVNVLELGTANGYSGIILGATGAHLRTIEKNRAMAKEAEQHFKAFGIDATVVVGDVIEEVKKMAKDLGYVNVFDIVFIDFEKKGYVTALKHCLKLVRIGGYIIADNVDMEKCQEFKEEIFSNSELKTEIVHIGDGLSISEKLY